MGEKIPKEEKKEMERKILGWKEKSKKEAKIFLKDMLKKVEGEEEDFFIPISFLLFIFFFVLPTICFYILKVSWLLNYREIWACTIFPILIPLTTIFFSFYYGRTTKKNKYIFFLYIVPIVFINFFIYRYYFLKEFKPLMLISTGELVPIRFFSIELTDHIIKIVLYIALFSLLTLLILTEFVKSKKISLEKEDYLYFSLIRIDSEEKYVKEKTFDLIARLILFSSARIKDLRILCETNTGTIYNLGRDLRVFLTILENKFSFIILREKGRHITKDDFSCFIYSINKYIFQNTNYIASDVSEEEKDDLFEEQKKLSEEYTNLTLRKYLWEKPSLGPFFGRYLRYIFATIILIVLIIIVSNIETVSLKDYLEPIIAFILGIIAILLWGSYKK